MFRRLPCAIIMFFSHVAVQAYSNGTEVHGNLRHVRALKSYEMPAVDISEDLDPVLIAGFVAGALSMFLLLCFLSCCCGCFCRREQYYYDRAGSYGGGRRWSLWDCLALACIWEICCDRRQGYERF